MDDSKQAIKNENALATEDTEGSPEKPVEKETYDRLPGTSQDDTPPVEPPMEEVPLFGEDDLIINALEHSLAKVRDLISKQVTAKNNAKTKLDALHTERNELLEAIDVIQIRHADEVENGHIETTADPGDTTASISHPDALT